VNETLGNFFFWLLVAMGVALVVAVVGLALSWRSIRRLGVPERAGFFESMHYLPLGLVVLLDLLDFGLDIFAAPVSWLLLDRLGLKGLRNKAAIEALIPFTQPIPTFTLSWIAARYFNVGDELLPGAGRVIEGEARETQPPLLR
jgi:hypothetical protein